MSDPDAIDFQCPGCSMALRVPRANIPSAGLPGTCPKCQKELRVTQEGLRPVSAATPASVPPVPMPPEESPAAAVTEPPTPDEKGFYVRRPDGSVEFVEDRRLFRELRSGVITASDLLSGDQQDFHAARDWEELEPHLGAAEPTVSSTCYRHQSRISAGSCETCHRGYCARCQPAVENPTIRLRTCPACGGMLKPPDPRWSEKEFWHRLDEVLLYPVSDMAWVTTLGIGFLLWIGSRGLRGIPIYLMALAYLVHVIQRSARGDKKLGFGPDSTDMWYLAGSGLAAVIVSAVVILPIVLLNVFVIYKTFQDPTFALLALLNFPLILVALVYYPMALGMTAVWHNRWLSLNPRIVVDAIMTIPRDYAILIVAFAALGAIDWTLASMSAAIPFLGAIVSSCVAAYLGIIQAHILGWTLYMNARNLGWE